MNRIDKINKLSKSEFIKIFANIFEKNKWIAEKLHNEKPFKNFEDLCYIMLKIFKTATKENQIKILNAHPDLANKIKIGSLTKNSQREQKNSGLDQCSKEEFNKFESLNNLYKKKFGFPFILAIKDKSKEKILNEFKKRILNNANNEFNEAIIQVGKIANLRLDEINIK